MAVMNNNQTNLYTIFKTALERSTLAKSDAALANALTQIFNMNHDAQSALLKLYHEHIREDFSRSQAATQDLEIFQNLLAVINKNMKNTGSIQNPFDLGSRLIGMSNRMHHPALQSWAIYLGDYVIHNEFKHSFTIPQTRNVNRLGA